MSSRIQISAYCFDGRFKSLEVEKEDELATLTEKAMYQRLFFSYGMHLVVERFFDSAKSRTMKIRLHLRGKPFFDFKVAVKRGFASMLQYVHGIAQAMPALAMEALGKPEMAIVQNFSVLPDIRSFTFIPTREEEQKMKEEKKAKSEKTEQPEKTEEAILPASEAKSEKTGKQAKSGKTEKTGKRAKQKRSKQSDLFSNAA